MVKSTRPQLALLVSRLVIGTLGMVLAVATMAHAQVVSVSTTTSGNLRNVSVINVNRGSGVESYDVAFDLIGVDLTNFFSSNSASNVFVAAGEPNPAAGTRATLIEDQAINTGIINPGRGSGLIAAPTATTEGMGFLFNTPVTNGPGVDIIFAEIDPSTQSGDTITVSRVDGPFTSLTISTYDLLNVPNANSGVRTVGGGTPVDLTNLENNSLSGGGSTNQAAFFVGIDLTDLGYASGATASSLFLQGATTGDVVDPVFIAALPGVLENDISVIDADAAGAGVYTTSRTFFADRIWENADVTINPGVTLTIDSGATLTFDDGDHSLLGGGTFRNEGTFNNADNSGSDNLVLDNNSIFENIGTFDLQGSGDIRLGDTAGDSPTLVNTGEIKKSAGGSDSGGTSFVFTFAGNGTGTLNNNGGTLNAESGLLHVSPNNATSDASSVYTVSNGARLQLAGSWEGTLGSAISDGVVGVGNSPNGGVIDTFTVGAAGVTLDFTGDGFTWGGADINLNGNTLTNDGILNFDDTGSRNLGPTGTFNQNGTLNVQDGTLNLTSAGTSGNGAVWNVEPGATLNLNGAWTWAGDATISGGGTFDNQSTVTLSGGASTLTLDDADFTNSGTFNWPSALDGNRTLNGTGSFINTGTFNHSYGGSNDNLILAGDVTFVNSPGGVFNFNDRGDIAFSGSNSTFDNRGLVEKTVAGADPTFIFVTSGTFNNLTGGEVKASAGRLRIASGGTSDAGATWTANGGDLELAGEWTGTFAGSSSGSSFVRIRSSSNGSVESNFDVGTGGATLNISGNGLQWSDAQIDLNGNTLQNEGVFVVATSGSRTFTAGSGTFQNNASGEFNWSNGNISLQGNQFVNGGTINVSGNNTKILGGGTFDNAAGGTLNVTDGTLSLNGGGTSDPTASWNPNGGDIQLAGEWTGTFSGTATNGNIFLSETGTFSVGAGGVTFDIAGTNAGDGVEWNEGTIDTQGNNLNNADQFHILSGGVKTLTGGGEFVNQSGATLSHTGGTVTIDDPTLIRNLGTVTYSGSGARAYDGDGRFLNDTSGVATLSGSAELELRDTVTFENDGTFNWSGSGPIDLQDSSVFQNDGTFDVTGSFDRLITGTGRFINNGTFNHNAGDPDNIEGRTSGGVFENNGQFNFKQVADFELWAGYTFHNTASGIISKTDPGANQSLFFSNSGSVGGTLNNEGTLEVLDGNFTVFTSVTGGFNDITLTQWDGANNALTGGTWRVDSFVSGTARLDLQPAEDAEGGIHIIGPNATVILSGAAATFDQLPSNGTGDPLTVQGNLNLNNNHVYTTSGTLTIDGGSIGGDDTGGTLQLAHNVNSTASTTGTIEGGLVDLNGATRTFDVGAGGTLNVDSAIQGGAGDGLTKTGSGTLTLGGTSPNTYTGLTTVNGGTLRLDKPSGVNAVAGDIVVDDGTLFLNQHHQIADTSDITVNGSANFNNNQRVETVANVTLNSSFSDPNQHRVSNMTITDTLTITDGVVGLNSNTNTTVGALSMSGGSRLHFAANAGNTTLNIGAGGLTMSGATLHLGWVGLSSSQTAQINLNGNFTGSGTNAIDFLTTDGPRLLDLQAGTRSFDITSGTTTIDATIQNGGLTKTGTGTLNLSGNNTYTGLTTVSNGTLELNNTTGGNSISGDVALNSGTLRWDASNQIADGSTITQTGGILDLSNATETIANYNKSGGTGSTSGSGELIITDTFTSSGGGAFAINSNNGVVTANSVLYTGGSIVIGQGGGTLNVGAGGLTMQGTNLELDNNNARVVLSGDVMTLMSGTTAEISERLNSSFNANRGLDLNGATRTFTVADGTAAIDLDIGVPIYGNGGLTKAGDGTLRLSTDQTNTYTGTTTINDGVLALDSPTLNGAVPGDVTLNSGTLRWDASNQIADGSTITQTGGILDLSNATETIANYNKSGGTGSTSGSGELIITDTFTSSGGGAFAINSNNGVVTANSVLYTGGSIVIGQGGGTLNVGAGGLTMQGTNLELDNNNARVVLSGDVMTLMSGTTAEISERLNSSFNANRGLDLNGATRTFTVADGTAAIDLDIGVPIYGNGGLTKAGDGTLRLSTDQTNTYTGTTTINGGTLQLGNNDMIPDASDVVFGAAGAGATLDVAGFNDRVNGISSASGGFGLITNSSSGDSTLTLDHTASRFFSGIIEDGGAGGTVAIAKEGSGLYVPGGQSTYSGGTSLDDGLTVPTANSTGPAGAPTSGPFGTGTLTLNGGSMRSTTGGDRTIGNVVVINADTDFVSGGGSEKSLTFSGPVTLTGNHTINSTVGTGVAGKTVEFSGAIGDGGGGFGITKDGAGNLTLSGNNTYTGTTDIDAGTLLLNGAHVGGGQYTVASGAEFTGTGSTDADVVVQSGGLLSGNLTTGNLTINSGGNHTPGFSPGTTTVNGDYSMFGTLNIEFASAGGTPGTDHSFVDVNNTVGTDGLVDLTGGSLNAFYSGVSGSFNPTFAQVFTIIDNDLSDAVTGTFFGLDPGDSVFIDGGKELKIFYDQGDGNDVVLVSNFAGTGTVDQLYANDDWNSIGGSTILDGGNQEAGTPTVFEGVNAFNNPTDAFTEHNGFNGDLTLNGGSYGTVDLTGGSTGAPGIVNLQLVGDPDDVPNVTIASLTGDINDTINLDAGTAADTANGNLIVTNGDFAGDINGTGTLTVASGGSFTISGDNGYTGTTTVQSSGELIVGSDTALGGTAAGTTVANDARVVLADGVTVTGEAITLTGSGGNFNGALQAAAGGSAEWAGDVTLNAGARVGAGNGGTLEISGDIIGTNLIVSAGAGGSGTVNVSGAAKSYTGQTQILRGTLQLGATDVLPSGSILNVDSANANDDSIFDLNGFDQTVAGLIRGSTAGSGGSLVTNTNGGASTLTIDHTSNIAFDGVIDQTGGGGVNLIKTGSGTQSFTNDVTITDLTVNGGPMNFGNDAGDALTVTGNTNVGTTGTGNLLTVNDGIVNIGDGNGEFNIGHRTSGGTANDGHADFSSADSVNIDVETVRLGTNTTGGGSSKGSLTLSTIGTNVVTADTIQMGDTNNGANQNVSTRSEIQLGDSNTFNVNTLTIGDRKSSGLVEFAAGGTLTLNGRAGPGNTTNLNIGVNTSGTGTNPAESLLDLSGGTFNAELGAVLIGRHISNSGSGQGRLIMDAGIVTADTVTLAESTGSNPLNTDGIIEMNGGSFTIANGVSDGGGTTTVQVDGGTMTVDAGGFDVDTVRVGHNAKNGTLNVNGGAVRIGNGTEDFDVGRRDSGSGLSEGTANFAGASSVTIDVDEMRIGTDTAGSGGSKGVVTLSTAGANVITANELQLGDTNSGSNVGASLTSELHLGGGTNVINATDFTVGDRKSSGLVDILAGGSLTLRGTAGGATRSDLRIGFNSSGTGTTPVESFVNLNDAGDVDALVNELTIGRHGDNSGRGLGRLDINTGMLDINTLNVAVASDTGVSTSAANTMGAFNVSGDASVVVNSGFSVGVGGAVGTVDLSDGTITSTVAANFGLLGNFGTAAGTGNLIVSGGTFEAPDLHLAVDEGSFSTLTQTGGTINVTDTDSMIVGDAGTAVDNHSAGTTNVSGNLTLGNASTGNGTYNLSGTGILNVDLDTTVGNDGTGLVDQTGGTFNNVGDIDVGNSGTLGSSGTYNLQAGELTFGDTSTVTQSTTTGDNDGTSSTLTIGANGDFNFSGGTLSNVTTIVANNTLANSGDPDNTFVQNGGNFVVGVDGGLDPDNAATTRATTNIEGNYTTMPGAALSIDIFGNDLGDGDYYPGTLAGEASLVTDLTLTVNDILTSPTASDLLIVGDDDGTNLGIADLTAGITLDLDTNGVQQPFLGYYDVLLADAILIDPETFAITGGPGIYRIVDLVGGGQVLQVATPEPATILIWSLIGAALFGGATWRRRRNKTAA